MEGLSIAVQSGYDGDGGLRGGPAVVLCRPGEEDETYIKNGLGLRGKVEAAAPLHLGLLKQHVFSHPTTNPRLRLCLGNQRKSLLLISFSLSSPLQSL